MICRSCLRAASQARLPPSTQIRPQRFLSTLANTSATRSTSFPRSPRSSQPYSTTTTTPASAQPFSDPLTPAPGPDVKAQATEGAKKRPSALVKSSVPAGIPLKGLNFLKNAQDPLALPDDEYPAWLWTILDRQETKADAGAGDLFCTIHTYPA